MNLDWFGKDIFCVYMDFWEEELIILEFTYDI